MTPLQLTRSVQSLSRVRRIAAVLTQHGFGHIVARVDLGRFVPVRLRTKRSGEGVVGGQVDLGRRMALAFSDLGPTFVKLGQMLTTRPDLLPPEVTLGLRSLQDEVPGFDTEEAKRIIEEEIGKPVEESFIEFGDKPIACGSIGQVYRAKIEAGDVVVKVRRPGIEETIRLDLQILKWLAESLESLVPESRIYRPQMIVEEFGQLLSRELDYINEGSATERFFEAFADRPHISIPRVHWDYCSPKVLTLGALPGRNMESYLADDGSLAEEIPLDRPLIAREMMEAFLDQIFEMGLLHTDPHPGNLLLDPPSTLGMIDFGQVAAIGEELMTQMVIVVYGAVNREVDLVVDALADMDALGPGTDRRELQRSLRMLLDKYYGLPLKRFDIGTVVNEFSDVVRRHDVAIPREVVSLSKALGMISGLAMKMDPNLDVLALIKPRIKRVLRGRLSFKRLTRTAAVSSWHMVSLLKQAPSNLREMMRRLATGTWQLNVQHENIDRLANELDRSSNRVSIALVIAAIIVGSSVVVSADTQLTIFDIKVQWLGFVGYIVAGMLGFSLAWAIFRSGKLS